MELTFNGFYEPSDNSTLSTSDGVYRDSDSGFDIWSNSDSDSHDHYHYSDSDESN